MDKAPNGAFAIFPAILAFFAWVLSIASTCVCTFITRRVSLRGIDQSNLDPAGVLLLEDHGIGFWGWQNDGECYDYEVNGRSPSFDGQYLTASVFSTLTDLVGGSLVVFLLLGNCFACLPNRYEYVGYGLLLVSVLDGATLIVLGSSVCSNRFFDYATPGISVSQFATTSCGMGTGSILAIVSAIFWLLTGVVCLRSPLSSRDRVPNDKNRRGGALGQGGDEEGEDEEQDEAHQLYNERRKETERRYKEMFGDLDDSNTGKTDGNKADGGGGGGAAAAVGGDDSSSSDDEEVPTPKKRLSAVKEESEHDTNISGHTGTRHSKAYGSQHEQHIDNDDGFEDEPSIHDDIVYPHRVSVGGDGRSTQGDGNEFHDVDMDDEIGHRSQRDDLHTRGYRKDDDYHDEEKQQEDDDDHTYDDDDAYEAYQGESRGRGHRTAAPAPTAAEIYGDDYDDNDGGSYGPNDEGDSLLESARDYDNDLRSYSSRRSAARSFTSRRSRQSWYENEDATSRGSRSDRDGELSVTKAEFA